MDKFIDNPAAPIEVNDNDIDQAITKYPFLVVDCWAPWCGPCRMLSPVIDHLAETQQGTIAFAKLNVDESPATATKYGIRSIPNLLIFKNGQKVGDIIGAMPEAKLLDAINNYK